MCSVEDYCLRILINSHFNDISERETDRPRAVEVESRGGGEPWRWRGRDVERLGSGEVGKWRGREVER